MIQGGREAKCHPAVLMVCAEFDFFPLDAANYCRLHVIVAQCCCRHRSPQRIQRSSPPLTAAALRTRHLHRCPIRLRCFWRPSLPPCRCPHPTAADAAHGAAGAHPYPAANNRCTFDATIVPLLEPPTVLLAAVPAVFPAPPPTATTAVRSDAGARAHPAPDQPCACVATPPLRPQPPTVRMKAALPPFSCPPPTAGAAVRDPCLGRFNL